MSATMTEHRSHHAKRTPARDFNEHFRLDADFIAKFRGRKPKFGFGTLGEFTYYRTYSRMMENGQKESFVDTIERVVEGTYEIQRQHCQTWGLPWNRRKAQVSAQEMFTRIWDFKFLPPGRGLWIMGTKFMWERGSAALCNCAFVSTKDLADEPAEPFCFMLDMSMLGVGVGFDTEGAGKLRIYEPLATEIVYQIPDSREGWVESIRQLIHSYATPQHPTVQFDYSPIRQANTPINGFGGMAAGPAILQELHNAIRGLLQARVNTVLTSVNIVDLMNFIGKCIVAGNVRRTAEIAFGHPNDPDYVEMKDHRKFPAELKNHRWASNNSLLATVGMDYTKIAQQIATNGEPGLIWLDTMRKYGRLKDGPTGADYRVMGTNPCAEQSLEPYELCCLVESFPANHDSIEDYHRTLKFAYLYAKTVTLLPTHDTRTNAVTMRNRRIGLSQSGIVQAMAKFGRRRFLHDFCDKGYAVVDKWDTIYSEWLCIPRSIKKTSVKPSGTVSLLCGAMPGIHYPVFSSYWRRVRVAKDSPYVPLLQAAGYEVEPLLTDQERTVVVKFGVIIEDKIPTEREVGIYPQICNTIDLQTHWADNQVSVTIKFLPNEAGEIATALSIYDDRLKSISFLPLDEHGYEQAPYEAAPREEIEAYLATLQPINFEDAHVDAIGEKFCDGDACVR